MITNRTTGEYFTIGSYIAFKSDVDNMWRVSKISSNPDNPYKSSTLDFHANFHDRLLAETFMEASQGTDELLKLAKIANLGKTDTSPK